ncbi:hypothetical protein M8C21_002187 [Ambrosia artemisiifolia]|uniref:Uncharacterized protein n=1 Tax=Ambrosia artemisiifolia TaxID=4212 RepID=A0AAD5G6S7_AMBAR|nr:hypothetical protein M8C21_002187 [Ambrosia artemisiifolia]
MLSSSDGVVVVVRDSHQKRLRDVMVTVVACDGLVVMGKVFVDDGVQSCLMLRLLL